MKVKDLITDLQALDGNETIIVDYWLRRDIQDMALSMQDDEKEDIIGFTDLECEEILDEFGCYDFRDYDGLSNLVYEKLKEKRESIKEHKND